jgi:hypothetical protein
MERRSEESLVHVASPRIATSWNPERKYDEVACHEDIVEHKVDDNSEPKWKHK